MQHFDQLLNSETRVGVFKKTETNVKFSYSNPRTARKPMEIAKIGPKQNLLNNYANYSWKENKFDLCRKSKQIDYARDYAIVSLLGL